MRPTKKQQQLGKEWGWGEFEIAHGYGVFESEKMFLVISRIDDMETFESDYDAVKQAKKDGFKFIVNNIIACRGNYAIMDKYRLEIEDLKEEWL